ncbi:hypothetical protein AGLY_004651 [Aphis glycines]|uniref:Uncharacterized protein n=1 Tax=Aphis glycines TaxID=307491 RepID=A0A6G0TWT4_APHGL|nr:hypothetical protein AGLY_004651 [Aphis glycines]
MYVTKVEITSNCIKCDVYICGYSRVVKSEKITHQNTRDLKIKREKLLVTQKFMIYILNIINDTIVCAHKFILCGHWSISETLMFCIGLTSDPDPIFNPSLVVRALLATKYQLKVIFQVYLFPQQLLFIDKIFKNLSIVSNIKVSMLSTDSTNCQPFAMVTLLLDSERSDECINFTIIFGKKILDDQKKIEKIKNPKKWLNDKNKCHFKYVLLRKLFPKLSETFGYCFFYIVLGFKRVKRLKKVNREKMINKWLQLRWKHNKKIRICSRYTNYTINV